MLIDSHCHLHDREFFTAEEAEECLKRAREARVEKVVCIGTSHEDSIAAREFAASHDNVYWTYGIHPEHADSQQLVSGSVHPSAGLDFSTSSTGDQQPTYGFLRASAGYDRGMRGAPPVTTGRSDPVPKKAINRLPVAVGEVGLDYHYDGYDRDKQIKLFEQMLQLACDNDLPVSFHVREAYADFFPVVANFPKVRGTVHSFTDSKRVLKRLLNETEFYIGVNGLATYSTLPTPPLERILLETDAPFLAPTPYRGKKNEPAYVSEVAKWLADKLQVTPAEVAKITTANAETLFRLSD